ncbi:MAG: hypothetical protein ABJN14_13780 [Paracoccaceae bacterium]
MNIEDADSERLRNLEILSELIEARSMTSREFKRAIGTLDDDLKYVANALRKDPEKWRLNRSFHTVHAPSLTAVILMLDDIDQMESVSEDEMHQIFSSISRASALAKTARKHIERSTLSNAKVELEVLSEYAPQPTEPFLKSSRFSRALDSVASVSGSVWDGAKSSVTSVPSVVEGLQDSARSRVASVPKLAANLQKTMAGTFSDNISNPISMRLKASGRAIESGVGTGVGIGVVVGVLCPPLLPLTAGGAVLAAMRTWRKEMARASELNENERQQRIAVLKAERSAALRQLTHGAAALQMESDDLSMTLDVETGEVDAVILKGDYTGRMWSSLTSVEKANVVLFVAEGAAGILKILAEAATE